MCVIIRRKMKLYRIIGLLVLWTGVIAADNVTAAPGVSTTTSNEISAFIISIKITNRIYTDSLEDHQSQTYKILRQDVENMFFEIYSSAPSVHYQDIATMTFSNGSVIANSTVLFGSKQKSGQTVKEIFVNKYKHASLPLDLNINYTADQEPILVPSLSSLTAPINSSNIFASSESTEHNQAGNKNSSSSTTLASTISGSDKPRDESNSRTTSPQMHSTTDGSGFTNAASQTASNITPENSSVLEHASTFASTMPAFSLSTMTTYSSSTILTTGSSSVNTTAHPSNKTSTVSGSGSLNTTAHPSNKTSTVSGSGSLNTTAHPSNKTSTVSGSGSLNTTAHPNNKTSTVSGSGSLNTTTGPNNKTSTVSGSGSLNTTTGPNNKTSTVSESGSLNTTTGPSNKTSTVSGSGTLNTTTRPSSNISTMSASSSSVKPGKPVTQKPTGPEGSDTVATDQGVPGWGIAILVLAAIILFFMLVLLILLLLFWCCWWKQRGFMNVSDPDPTGYYNPDIPMYSTHSTYDSHNGKSLGADLERSSKNRTGMYAVNK